MKFPRGKKTNSRELENIFVCNYFGSYLSEWEDYVLFKTAFSNSCYIRLVWKREWIIGCDNVIKYL